MNPWFAKALVLAGMIVLIAIRAPHGQRSRGIKVMTSKRGRLELALLTLAWLASFAPLLWIFTQLASPADRSSSAIPLVAGSACLSAGLWLFHRSHADLGVNWSITLELREKHELVTEGIYRHVRHPMYLALLLYSVGQALVLSNWIIGPSALVAFTILVVLRVPREEQMMVEQFGSAYESYALRTKRLVPGVW